MSNNNKIASIIRSCRESRGYSQEYMAEMLNIGQSAYANIESGKTSLSIARLLKLTEILELDIHQIIDTQFQFDLKAYSQSKATPIQAGTKDAYDLLITELKSEIDFLRSLVKAK